MSKLSSVLFAAAVSAGLAMAAFASELTEIIVETTPVQAKNLGQQSGGSAIVLYSINYRVSLAGLDLTKQADVARLQDQIKTAATKGCKAIKDQYPLDSMSDEQSCITAAIDGAKPKVQQAINAAEKKAKS
ncbi:MAG TPA: UrcA family protein [Steroidobacteraceae bacterium]|nr:UrcA family protein [Steroidobacteraceae bacterium]